MAGLAISRAPQRLRADPRRVIAKPYLPGEEIAASDAGSRAGLLIIASVILCRDSLTALTRRAASSGRIN